MTDYRYLSYFEKKKVDDMIVKEVEPGVHINENNGYKWNEPEATLKCVHQGTNCAECLMIYYNCLCNHD